VNGLPSAVYPRKRRNDSAPQTHFLLKIFSQHYEFSWDQVAAHRSCRLLLMSLASSHAPRGPAAPMHFLPVCVCVCVGGAACLLGMQSPRKVPKLTKIKRGQVARADLKESCEIFYVLAIGWPLIYATRMELQSVNS